MLSKKDLYSSSKEAIYFLCDLWLLEPRKYLYWSVIDKTLYLPKPMQLQKQNGEKKKYFVYKKVQHLLYDSSN